MVLVLALGAMLWGMGALMKAPRRARWVMIGLLYIAVLGLHVGLSDGHPLRMATGESSALWAILGGAAALVLVYREVLSLLRNKADANAKSAEPLVADGPFSDTELNRYARHIVLREVGGLGQKKLKDAKIGRAHV